MQNASASILLLAALAAAPAIAAAQAPAVANESLNHSSTHSLAGTVADSLSRQALPFATVVLQAAIDAKNLLSTVANAQGAFRLEAVPAGKYELQVRYVGYKNAAPVAVTVGDGQVATLAPVLLAADRKLQIGRAHV